MTNLGNCRKIVPKKYIVAPNMMDEFALINEVENLILVHLILNV